MPVMYHFRIEKDVLKKSEQAMYDKLIADLAKHDLNKFFEFSAKAKDMDDNKGKVFRFTAKVRAEGDVNEQEFGEKLKTLVELLNHGYGIDLSDAYTTRAKLKNSIVKGPKTIEDDTFDRLTSTVTGAVNDGALTVEQMCDKMGEMWADNSEHNVFKEVAALNNMDELNYIKERLNKELNALTTDLEYAKEDNQRLTQIKTQIKEVKSQLDTSNLDAASQATVDKQRTKEIDAKQSVTEKVYPDHNRDNFDFYRRIGTASALINSIQSHESSMREQINHQHKTKGGLLSGAKNTKSPAQQAFDEAFFNAHIKKTTAELKKTQLNALTKATNEISTQFSSIEAIHREIEAETPYDTAAEIKVADDELVKLTIALNVQRAFEASAAKELEPLTLEDIPVEIINSNASSPSKDRDSATTDIERGSSPDVNMSESSHHALIKEKFASKDVQLDMHHFRIEQEIPKGKSDDYVNTVKALKALKQDFFDFQIALHSEEKKDNKKEAPHYLIMKVKGDRGVLSTKEKSRGEQSSQLFMKQVEQAFNICNQHHVDVSAFIARGGKATNAEISKVLETDVTEFQSIYPQTAVEKIVSATSENSRFNAMRKIQETNTIEEEQSDANEKLASLVAKQSLVERAQATNQQLMDNISKGKQQIKSMHQNVPEWDVISQIENSPLSDVQPFAKAQLKATQLQDYPSLQAVQNHDDFIIKKDAGSKAIVEKQLPQISHMVGKKTADSLAKALFDKHIDAAFDEASASMEAMIENKNTFKTGTLSSINAVESWLNDDSNHSIEQLQAEGAVLQEELSNVVHALRLAEGIKQTLGENATQKVTPPPLPSFPPPAPSALPEQQITPPPIPSFRPEEEQQRNTRVQVTADMAKDLVNSAMSDAIKSVVTSQTQSKVKAEIPLETIRTTSPNGRPEGWRPPPPPPRVDNTSNEQAKHKKASMDMFAQIKNRKKDASVEQDVKAAPSNATKPPPPPPRVDNTSNEQAKHKMASMDMFAQIKNRKKDASVEQDVKAAPSNATKPPPPPPKKPAMSIDLKSQIQAGKSNLKSKTSAENMEQGAPSTTNAEPKNEKPTAKNAFLAQLQKGQDNLKSKKSPGKVEQALPATTSAAQNDTTPAQNKLMEAIKKNQRRASSSDVIDGQVSARREKKRRNSILGGIEKLGSLKKVTSEMKAADKEAKEQITAQARRKTHLGHIEANNVLKPIPQEVKAADELAKAERIKQADKNAVPIGSNAVETLLARRKQLAPDESDSDDEADWSDDEEVASAPVSQSSTSNYGSQGSHSPAMFQNSGTNSGNATPNPDDELDKDKDSGLNAPTK